MFDKMKNLANMQRQAKQLQKELEKIIQTEEKNGWTVSVTGDQKIRYIKHGEEDMKQLTDLINEAMKKVQKTSAKKMMDMGGGLSGLLGGMGK
jgi:DNA-binding protein YbaB